MFVRKRYSVIKISAMYNRIGTNILEYNWKNTRSHIELL